MINPTASRTPELRDLLEPRIRHVVAEQLAVDERALGDSISIRDDLAADSLDFLELTLLLEHEFRIPIPDTAVETMWSYRDVVDLIVRLVAVRCTDEARNTLDAPSPHIRAQLSMPAHAATGSRYWAGSLTPYMAETLADATRHAGSGASLHVAVVTEATSATLSLVQALFARSGKGAIDLLVTRDADDPRRDVQHRMVQ